MRADRVFYAAMVVLLAATAMSFLDAGAAVCLAVTGVFIVIVGVSRVLREQEREHTRRQAAHDEMAATLANWLQTLARRSGQLSADSWVCKACLQSNVGWDDECGRCLADKRTGKIEEGMTTESRWFNT